MHASFHQLLDLRDGQPVAADVAQHVATCVQCGNELARLTLLRERLGALPAAASVPAQDDALWRNIQESLVTGPNSGRPLNRYLAIAAAVVWAAVALVWLVLAGDAPVAERALDQRALTSPALDELVAESQRLEGFLQQLPRAQMQQAATAATADALEGRIQWLDYALSAEGETVSPEQATALWEQRVELLGSLVTLRYAQVERVSF